MRHQNLCLNHLKVVVFDWDNTLAESRTALVFCVNKILAEYQLPEWEQAKKLRDNNLSFRDNFPRIFGEKAEEAYAKYVKIYMENVADMISAFDGTHDVLNFLKEHGVLIAIMTNKDRNLIEFELPILFKRELFDKIVCGHEAKRDKPYPEHAEYTLEGLIEKEDISRDTVWIVGDSPQDSTCARHVNALPIRIGSSLWGDEYGFDENMLHYPSFCEFYQDLCEIRA